MPIKNEEHSIEIKEDEEFEVVLGLLQPDKSPSEIALGHLIKSSNNSNKIAIKRAFPEIWERSLREGKELHKKINSLPNSCLVVFFKNSRLTIRAQDSCIYLL